jgi:integrase
MGEYLKTRYPGIFQYAGKNGMVYGIDYRSGGKKHREIVGPLLGEAQEKLAEIRKQAKNGVVLSVSEKRKITFRSLAQKYSEIKFGKPAGKDDRKYLLGYWRKDKKDGEVKWNDKSITQHFGDRALFQICAIDIEEFKKARKEAPAKGKKSRSDVSVNREMEILRNMMNKAIEWGMLDVNPFQRFKESVFFEETNDRVRFLEEEDIKKLLEISPPYLANLIKAAIFTGLRKSDLFNLRWSDVNLEKGILFFHEGKKRGKLGIKYLNDDMVSLLIGIHKGKSEYIFNGPVPRKKGEGKKEKYVALPDPDGNPLSDIKRSFHAALKKAGIKDFHWHDLRHTSASYLAMKGASLKAVQEHLGHSSIAMTERYSHLSENFQREQVNLLNGLCGESGKKLVRNEVLIRNEAENEINATA